MSKEELNNEVSNSQTGNVLTDNAFNTPQIDQSDLIHGNGESNQFSNETDNEINSEPSCQNENSSLISEDLKNVNKHEDIGSVNENSTLEIKEAVSPNDCTDQSLSQSHTDLNTTENSNAVERVTLPSENEEIKEQEGSSETLEKSDLQKKAENNQQVSTDSESEKAYENTENPRTSVEEEISGESVYKKSADICTDSGPHFSHSEGSNDTTDKTSDHKEGTEITKSLECQFDEKQEPSEFNVNSRIDSAITKEQTNDKDLNNPDEKECEIDRRETDNYEDDFEEVDDKDQCDISKGAGEVDTDKKEQKDTLKGDERETLDEIKEKQALEAVTCTSEGQEKDHNISPDQKTEEGKTSVSVNDEIEEKELTEIIIDEEGIPKVAITTVPDRPPSSLASDTNKSDPLDDFQADSEEAISNKTELNGIDHKDQTVDSEKETTSDAFKEEKLNDPKKETIEKEENNSETLTEEEKRLDCANMENSDDDKGQVYTKTAEQENNKETHLSDTNDLLTKEENSESQIGVETNNADTVQENNQNKHIDEGIAEQSTNEQGMEVHEDDADSQSQNNLSTRHDGKTAEGKNTDEDNTKTKESTKEKKTEEKPKSPEPVPIPKQESPLEQMLRRNVKIDGCVDSVTELESNVTTLLSSMKDVMKYYSDLLKLQALKDFTTDLGKFKGDFTSINEAFKRCNSMSQNINHHLKELRHITEDIRTQFHRKFQQEDLSTWIDLPPKKEKEKERLQEETIAAEKAAMAKAAEARHAVATAISGIAEAHQLIAEMETQAADAEAISHKASAQARTALIAAEEAKVAAEERRRAEEAAKKRAEERARIKAAEEEKKRALEEMKIHKDAAAKGTSVEDERRTFMEEKRRKELERKDPKNWPRFSYKTDGIDFKPAIGCIIRAMEGSTRNTDVTCSFVDQSLGILRLGNTEELVSNIIEVKQVEEDRSFSFEEPLSVALPVAIGRVPSGKETVVKQLMSNGAWRELPSSDVQFEDYRELKFVEGRCNKFGTYAVVLRPKKDTLLFQKKGSKLLCSSDSRISFTNKPGTFKQNINAILEVQTLDVNVVPDLKMRSPKECEDLLSTSPFIKFSVPVKNFDKPLTVTLPLPQTQTRQKRPATGITRETKSQDVRPSTARPSTTTEDDPTEEIFFLHRDDKSCWTVNTKMHLVQPKSKDTVTFDIAEPYQRMILLRTKAGKSVAAVEKMTTLLENITTQRNVKVIVRQRNDDVADVMVACTSSNRTDRTLKYLEERSFTEGPNPSPDIVLREGQQLYLKFRGNVECISENPSLNFIFNTNIRATREFKINEKEEFAQKSLPSYRGFIQVFRKAVVPKPVPEGAPKHVQPEMVEAEVLLTELLVELPKPEAEPPKPLTTAPLLLKEGPLTNGVLRYIAGMLGKEWKDVAAQLNLKPMRIQAILRNHVNKDTAETRFDMLVTWAKRVPKAVDKVQILYNALIACGRPDIAEEVRHRGQEYKQQRFMSARVSHLRQAFVKVAKTTSVFNRWKAFAKEIGVPQDQIERIDEGGGSGQEKCYTSLETWKDVAGEEATVTSLATFLKTAKQDRLSRDVEALVAP